MNKNKEIMVKYVTKVEKGELEFDEALNELYDLSENNSELYQLLKNYEKNGIEGLIHDGVLTLEKYSEICNVDARYIKHGENDYEIVLIKESSSVRSTLEEILLEIEKLK
ncbi:hypothetical protein [Vagococcus fluvialis]|nr:hypothetical protein [Vagococcus fluvialis]UDM78318.1 hypothetical protein K5K98_14710 [Vagococcus fluvialis]UDM84037.1 hypothetical protein K5K96_14530 [Vagococcus fluvialis]